MITPIPWDDQEPSAAELAAIEAEWPLIDAELAMLDAQIRALTVGTSPSQLDRRRVRRAQRRVLAARLHLAAAAAPAEVPGVAS